MCICIHKHILIGPFESVCVYMVSYTRDRSLKPWREATQFSWFLLVFLNPGSLNPEPMYSLGTRVWF